MPVLSTLTVIPTPSEVEGRNPVDEQKMLSMIT